MASKRFYVIDEGDRGIIQSREKENIGFTYVKDAPVGNYLDCYLENHWIISEEDYALLKEAKKNK